MPEETVEAIVPSGEEGSIFIACGTVKIVYAPEDRDEAVVPVEIRPQPPA